MILIGENINIISKSVKEALSTKNTQYLKQFLDMECVDLNIGPKNQYFDWLVPFVKENSTANISFDTTNSAETEKGLKLFGNCENCFINSASKDRFDKMSDLALEYNCNLILLTMDSNGIPKTADGRFEIAYELYEKCIEKGLNPEKLYFDPLVLPLSVDQSQAMEAVNTIRVIKESLDVKTIVGLSNISNGSPDRNLINHVFACFVSDIDAAIIDCKDKELIRIFNMLKNNSPNSEIDEVYIQISDAVKNFGEFMEYNDVEKQKIAKAAKIISGGEIYSHSFTQI